MVNLPEPIAALVTALARLPGIGPRTAERLALHLVQADPTEARLLADCLVSARERVRLCQLCGGLTEQDPCPTCSAHDRDAHTVCLVEWPVDILRIQKAGGYRGRFHVLGGRLSPIQGVGPEDLRIEALEQRLKSEPIREIIVALGTDVEGDATSHYLAKRLASSAVKVSRIAFGISVGSSLEFTDEMTLTRAIEGRREMT